MDSEAVNNDSFVSLRNQLGVLRQLRSVLHCTMCQRTGHQRKIDFNVARILWRRIAKNCFVHKTWKLLSARNHSFRLLLVVRETIVALNQLIVPKQI